MDLLKGGAMKMILGQIGGPEEILKMTKEGAVSSEPNIIGELEKKKEQYKEQMEGYSNIQYSFFNVPVDDNFRLMIRLSPSKFENGQTILGPILEKYSLEGFIEMFTKKMMINNGNRNQKNITSK